MLNELTTETLAMSVGLSADELIELSARAPRMYRVTKKPKKSGRGMRSIEAPHPELKRIQRRLLDNVLAKSPVRLTLFGSKGHSPKGAVSRHIRKPLVVTMDISDFFPSVKRHMVRKALMKRGAPQDLAELMTRLMTHGNHLAQGAPTSTRMAMLVLDPVAGHIEKALASIPRADLSVWVDDATISGPSGIERLVPTIVRIFDRHGFRIHPNKLKFMPRSEEQVSLGIKLNNRVEVPSSYIEKYRREGLPLVAEHPKRMGMEAHMRHVGVGG